MPHGAGGGFHSLLRSVAQIANGACGILRHFAEKLFDGGARLEIMRTGQLELAEDLGALSRSYRVTEMVPYDFFPHTPHIETLAILRWGT